MAFPVYRFEFFSQFGIDNQCFCPKKVTVLFLLTFCGSASSPRKIFRFSRVFCCVIFSGVVVDNQLTISGVLGKKCRKNITVLSRSASRPDLAVPYPPLQKFSAVSHVAI